MLDARRSSTPPRAPSPSRSRDAPRSRKRCTCSTTADNPVYVDGFNKVDTTTRSQPNVNGLWSPEYRIRGHPLRRRCASDGRPFDDLSERGGAMYDAAQDAASSLEERLEALITERPLATVGPRSASAS